MKDILYQTCSTQYIYGPKNILVETLFGHNLKRLRPALLQLPVILSF